MIIVVIIGVLAGIIATVSMKKYAQKIFNESGVNTFSFLHKLLWYIEMLGIFGGIVTIAEESKVKGILLLITVFAVSVALHFLMAIKAKKHALPMAILQSVAGVIAALVNTVIFVWGIALGNGPLGAQSIMGIDTHRTKAAAASQEAAAILNIEELNQIAVEKGYKDAADLTGASGYSSIREAVSAGVFRK